MGPELFLLLQNLFPPLVLSLTDGNTLPILTIWQMRAKTWGLKTPHDPRLLAGSPGCCTANRKCSSRGLREPKRNQVFTKFPSSCSTAPDDYHLHGRKPPACIFIPKTCSSSARKQGCTKANRAPSNPRIPESHALTIGKAQNNASEWRGGNHSWPKGTQCLET